MKQKILKYEISALLILLVILAIGSDMRKQAKVEIVPEPPQISVDTPVVYEPLVITTTTYEHKEIFKCTAYCTCVQCCGIWSKQHPDRINDDSYQQHTKTGTVPIAGQTVAIDPNVIPFGTKIEIAGIKGYVAEDTGNAVKGNHIDIFFADHEAARQFGVQYLEVKW